MLDPEKSATNVASATKVQGSTEIGDKLVHYFRSTKEFNVKVFLGVFAEFSGCEEKAKVAFNLLRLQK